MILSQREKNSSIIIFTFYVLLFFVLIYCLIQYLYPNILKIEASKNELRQLYENILKTEKEWLSYNDFITLNSTKEDVYFRWILNNISEDYYNKNFINNWSWSFSSFIDSKIKSINSKENQAKLISQNDKVSKILPSYLENSSWKEKNILTNFKFINYVENIFETFNLRSSDKIWISNIELLWDYQKLNWLDNNLDVNIFALPLKLTIEWKKESIINFIYFAQHVWNININNDISIYSDSFLKTIHWNIVFKWDYNNSRDYNIYKNQIFEIEYIKFWDYIDSSFDDKWNSNFIDFLKKNQWDEDYKIDVKLNFYVKWIQQFELSSYIKSILDKYSELNSLISKKLKNVNIDKYDLVTYKKANSYLNEIREEINSLSKELEKNINLEDLYNKVIKYNTSFIQIEKLIN